MLDKAFIYFVELTVPASMVICMILLLRLMLKGQKKIWSYALWLVVLLRLVLPAGIAVPVHGLEMPAVAQRYTLSDVQISLPEAVEGITQGNPTVTVEGSVAGKVDTISCNRWELAILYGKYLWLAGVLAVAAWGLASYVRLRKKLKESVHWQDNIYVADGIPTPFVMGLIAPNIYLPTGLTEVQQRNALLHEQRHIARDDHIFRLTAFAVLCLHWFNPLVWVAFLLSGRDMEMSCDEAVARLMTGQERAEYAESLLHFSNGPNRIAGMPLAFGEVHAGKRIRNLGKWKKSVLWLCILAVALSLPLMLLRPANAAEPVEEVYNGSFFPSVPIEFTMQEFPGAKFEVCETLDAVNRTRVILKIEWGDRVFGKLVTMNAGLQLVLADLNGDGYRELCFLGKRPAQTWHGLIVYDLKNNKAYSDLTTIYGEDQITYRMDIQNGSLMANRSDGTETVYGKLRIMGNKLMILTKNGALFIDTSGRTFYSY